MGAFFRLLSTLSHPFEDMPDPGETIGDAKVLLDEAGHPGPGPEFISAAMGASTLVQEFDEPLLLVEAQAGLTAARMGFGVEARVGELGCGVAPSADGTGGGLDVSGHVPNTPDGLQEGDGDATSNFELDSCAFRSHRPLTA